MVKRIQRFKVAEVWTSNKRFNYTLPKAPISKIIITGTETSCGAGSLVANTVFEFIQLRINGKMFLDFSGDWDDDKVPFSWQIWREFYKQKHRVAMPDEMFVIELPYALPKDAQIDLILKCRALSNTGCTSALVYNWDINFEMEDKVPGKVLVPYVIPDKFDYATNTKDQIDYVPAIPFRLRAICFLVEDDGTLSATPNADINRLRIEDSERIYFDGSLQELTSLQEGRSQIALTAGHYIFIFPGGIKVGSQTLKLTFTIDSAGTDVEVHLLYISY